MKEIFKNAGLLKAPEGFTERLMNLVIAEGKKNSAIYQPVISRRAWWRILFICVSMLLVVGYFSVSEPPGTTYAVSLFEKMAGIFSSLQVPVIKFPTWPVLLFFIALISYLVEDYLIRNFFKQKKNI